jgi:hypothetical protein
VAKPDPLAQVKTRGAGASAAAGSVAAGENGIAAMGNVVINEQFIISRGVRDYMTDKGPRAYRGMGDPDRNWSTAPDGAWEIESVDDLRDQLLNNPSIGEQVKKKPRSIRVKGVLYPCALLVSGWWESRIRKIEGTKWQSGVQEWLFSGFHSWGPSWDFTWDFGRATGGADRPSVIAQLGSGDEANSIPVIIPVSKAKELAERFQQRGDESGIEVGGLTATVSGVLCHRSYCPEAARLGLVGGILDYCIWLKPGEERHKITPHRAKPDIYSGYLWKCVAPAEWLKGGGELELNQVYFIWEHTNFVDESSVKYNIDSLDAKERYIRRLHGPGELALLQKSSVLVPGEPAWTKEEFYDFFQQKDDDI